MRVSEESLTNILQQALLVNEIIDFDNDDSPKGVAATASRICQEISELEQHFLQSNINFPLRDLQAACLEHNISFIKKYTKGNRGLQAAYYPLISSLESVLKLCEFRVELGQNRIMMSAHPESATLENARYKLLEKCYVQILRAENGEIEEVKVDNTILLARLIILGEPEGKFPSADSTLVEDACNMLYKSVWEYFEQVFYVNPFGPKLIAHYDREFYSFCIKLIKEKENTFDKKSLWEAVKVLPERFPDPQIRLQELFKTFELLLKNKLTLASEQIAFKSILRGIAIRYGFDEQIVKALAFNAPQRRICSTASITSLCELSFVASPDRKAMSALNKSISDLSITEHEIVTVMSNFVNGDKTIRGSLKSLMSRFKEHSIDCIQQAKIRTIEDMYTLLLIDMGNFSRTVSDCVASPQNEIEKLNFLYSIIAGDNRYEFTNYMLHLSISTLFMDRFVNEVKSLLITHCPKVEVQPYDEKIGKSFQHMQKLAADLNRIRKTVVVSVVNQAINLGIWQKGGDQVQQLMEPWPSGCDLQTQLEQELPAGANQLIQVRLMDERIRYFGGLVNVLREFITVNQFIEGDEEVHRVNCLNRLTECVGIKCAKEVSELVKHWVELWDRGVLSIDLVSSKLSAAISGELCNDSDTEIQYNLGV